MGKKNRTFTSGWAPPGGWKGDIGEGLENMALPDPITCALCERDLPKTSYSASALRRLHLEVRRNGLNALDNQQVARCEGCGTQSRPELQCMSCNKVRPIDDFAHTQRQYDQPVCLPCQDDLQLDERDKGSTGQVSRDMGKSNMEQRENPGSAVAFTETSSMADHGMSKESSTEEEDDKSKSMNRYDLMRAEQWISGSASNSTTRNSPWIQNEGEEMHFDAVFEDDEETAYSGSYQW